MFKFWNFIYTAMFQVEFRNCKMMGQRISAYRGNIGKDNNGNDNG